MSEQDAGDLYFVTFSDRPGVIKICLTSKKASDVVKKYFGPYAEVCYVVSVESGLREYKRRIRNSLKEKYRVEQELDYFQIETIELHEYLRLLSEINQINEIPLLVRSMPVFLDIILAIGTFGFTKLGWISSINVAQQVINDEYIKEMGSFPLTTMMIEWLEKNK